MRNVLSILGAVALSLTAGCGVVEDLLGGSPDEKAYKRVVAVFDAVSADGASSTEAFQRAACTWYKDKIHISDLGEFELAHDGLIEFMRAGGLAKGFRYSIDEWEESGEGIVFFGKANGNKFELVVPDRQPFRWRVSPRSE
jgi:hypothetical protein